MTRTLHAHARSPIDPWHEAHGARFTSSGPWQLPAAYGGVEREVAAARSSCGIVDLSAFAKWRLLGAGVANAVEGLGAAALRKPRGAAILDGGAFLACRLTVDSLLLLDSGTDPERMPARLAAGYGVVQVEATSALAGFCLAGPAIEQVLPGLVSLDSAALLVGSCAETGLDGVQTLLVRVAELSVPCVRMYVAWDVAEYVWMRVLEAGRHFGLTPFGLDALRVLAVKG